MRARPTLGPPYTKNGRRSHWGVHRGFGIYRFGATGRITAWECMVLRWGNQKTGELPLALMR